MILWIKIQEHISMMIKAKRNLPFVLSSYYSSMNTIRGAVIYIKKNWNRDDVFNKSWCIGICVTAIMTQMSFICLNEFNLTQMSIVERQCYV